MYGHEYSDIKKMWVGILTWTALFILDGTKGSKSTELKWSHVYHNKFSLVEPFTIINVFIHV